MVPVASPLDETANIEVVLTGVTPRSPVLKSRKFWCVIVCTVLPVVNHYLFHMDISHVYAMMAPWMAWGGGEWGIDAVKSWHEAKGGLR